jgi:predicted DNA binding CopG/RHH family protein
MNRDDYEKELIELEEKGLIEVHEPELEEKRALMEAAKNTLQKDRQVSIRLSGRNLVSLKRKANPGMEFLIRPSFPACTIVTPPATFTSNKPPEMKRHGDADSARKAAVDLRNYGVKGE